MNFQSWTMDKYKTWNRFFTGQYRRHGWTAHGGTAELWLGTSKEETVRMTGRRQHQGRRMGQRCSPGRDEHRHSACSAMVLSAVAASGCGSVLHTEGESAGIEVAWWGNRAQRRAMGAAHLQWGRQAECDGGGGRGEDNVWTGAALMPAAQQQGTPPRPANRSMAPGDKVTASWAPPTTVLMG
jgi:hypothetical protein